MSAKSTGFQATPGSWQWPDDILPTADPPAKPSAKPSAEQEQQSHADTGGGPQTGAPKARRYYKPRTCRICFETVQPSFHAQSDYVPGVFQGPSVTYDSEGGKLIRPCKCKGSSNNRTYWKCPTCSFSYKLERLTWGRWISSKSTQLLLTLFIFLGAVFILGFIADPIINIWLDPYDTIASIPSSRRHSSKYVYDYEDENGWAEHFVKGLASLGLLGFVKVLLSLSPFQWWNMRASGVLGGRPGNTGQGRLAGVSWIVVLLGICTFIYTVWKGVRAWSRRILEKAGERVMDVQGDDDEDIEEEPAAT